MPDVEATIRGSGTRQPHIEVVDRLNRCFDAGADCLFVPGISDIKTLTQLVGDVKGPVSFGMGASDQSLSLNQLTDIGIRRISTGGGLARVAINEILKAARTIATTGEFDYVDNVISEEQLHRLL